MELLPIDFWRKIWETYPRSLLTFPLVSLPGFVAQTIWEGFLQAKWAREILTKEFGKQNVRFWAMIPKETLTKTLVTFPQIFLPQTMGNDPIPCSCVYVIGFYSTIQSKKYYFSSCYYIYRKSDLIFLCEIYFSIGSEDFFMILFLQIW